MEYMGKPHPVMNCNSEAKTAPAPPLGTPEYAAWKHKLATSPEVFSTLEIAFPRYYWRARFIQKTVQPFFFADSPMTGNVVLLKDCAFINNVDLRLPNGSVIRGFPYDDMSAELIRKHTAILEQEGLFSKGDGDIKAAIAELEKATRRAIDEGVKRIEQITKDATRKPGEGQWWENLWAAFKRQDDNLNEGEKWGVVARAVLSGVWENAGNPNWTSVYLGQTSFRRLAKEYRNLKTTRTLWRDKLWTLLDRQWTTEQEKAWARNLRRYAERERDKAEKKTARPKKPG